MASSRLSCEFEPDLLQAGEWQVRGCGQDLDGAGGDSAVVAVDLPGR
ncbi:hypothetical protein [Alloactinosynnema sp. L-07]|nr:hypothetical protein [Alloactinosynnema sp. L-07]